MWSGSSEVLVVKPLLCCMLAIYLPPSFSPSPSSIRMLLWDRDERTYGYYIEVSTDQKTWTRVVDRSTDSYQ